MDKELQKLIENFNKKLSEAQDARSEVMAYLEDEYGIDTDYEYETLEDECDWCYGIDIKGVEKLINRRK
jgi:hypothetical protein